MTIAFRIQLAHAYAVIKTCSAAIVDGLELAYVRPGIFVDELDNVFLVLRWGQGAQIHELSFAERHNRLVDVTVDGKLRLVSTSGATFTLLPLAPPAISSSPL